MEVARLTVQPGKEATLSENVSQKLNKVIQIDEEQIQQHLSELVRGTVEGMLNKLLDAEADQLCNAARYESTEARTDQRAGHYRRKLRTNAGEVSLKMPKLRRHKFETAIIERYRRRESSVEEALMELKRTWAEQMHNVWVLVAVGVTEGGFRQVLGVVEGAKEYKAGWSGFLRHLRERGLKGVKLVISDACIGLVESVNKFYPDAKWQRCVVHF